MNNIDRTFPLYWWTPADLRHPKGDDIELEAESGKVIYKCSDAGTSSYDEYTKGGEPRIVISDEHIHIPECISLDGEDKAMLELLRSKLQEGLRDMSSRDRAQTHVHD